MSIAQPGRLLRIHICEGDRSGEQPLYEALLGKCIEMGIAGATVFRALEGYGETAAIHRKHLLARDQPILVVIVDSEENIARALPVLEQMVDTGVIAASAVTIKRVQSSGRQTADSALERPSDQNRL